METYHVEKGVETHGYDGPLHVSRGGSSSVLADQFIDAGKRSDAAHAYVHPTTDKQDNLHLLVAAKVVRVLFNGTKAIGVKYVQKYTSHTPHSNTSKNLIDDAWESTLYRIHARKLVVLAAGALSTPLILERSGVGSAKHLSALSIPCISNLPGVGENFQDHQVFGDYFQVNAGEDDTSDDIVLQVPETMARITKEYEETGKGPLATNFIDAAIKLRPTDEEVQTMDPEFIKFWERDNGGSARYTADIDVSCYDSSTRVLLISDGR